MRQYDFETAKFAGRHDARRLPPSINSHMRSEARKQREIEARKRTVSRIRTMLVELEREVANLDVSISSELTLARVRDPAHPAYPISARMMEARRQNLKATVAALSERLALMDLARDDLELIDASVIPSIIG